MFLRITAEVHKLLDQLLFRHLPAELDKHCRSMTVQNRNADALAGDDRLFGADDLAVLDMAEHTQRFLLTLLFLTADVGDDVPVHLRPVFEGLACSRDSLIGRRDHFVGLEFLPGCQRRCVGLDRAVRLDSDKAFLRAESLLLSFDHLEMIQIDLRDDHRNVRRPAVRTVVGDNGRLCLRVIFFDLSDLILGHIDSGEDHVDLRRDFLYFIYIVEDHLPDKLRHVAVHLPSAADCLFVCLALRSLTGGKYLYLKIRMIGKQSDESLSDHTGCSQDTDFQFFHNLYSSMKEHTIS